MKSWLLAIFLAVVAIAPIMYIVYHVEDVTSSDSPVLTTVEFVKSAQTQLEVGGTYEVRACKVIDGYRFGLFLEGNKWIEAHLPTATKEEATPVVIELLNKVTAPVPTVRLLRKLGSCWIVEFRLTVNQKQETLTQLLKAKNLLLE